MTLAFPIEHAPAAWWEANQTSTLFDIGGIDLSQRSSFLYAASNSDFQTGDVSFWVGCWVKLFSRDYDQVLVAKDDYGQREFCLSYEYAVNRFRFEIFRNNQVTKVNANNFGLPPLNQWTLVLGFYDAGTKTLYLGVNDTAWDSQKVTAYTGSAGTAPFTVGGRFYPNQADILNGCLQNVAFGKFASQRILNTAVYIRSLLYNAGSGASADTFANTYGNIVTGAGCLGFWEFNEDSGARVSNLGSYSLTPFNSVSWSEGKVRNSSSLNGDKITQWDDISGNNVYLKAVGRSTLDTNQINGLYALTMDGTASAFKIHSTSFTSSLPGLTLVAAVKSANTGTGERVLFHSTTPTGSTQFIISLKSTYLGDRWSYGARRVVGDSLTIHDVAEVYEKPTTFLMVVVFDFVNGSKRFYLNGRLHHQDDQFVSGSATDSAASSLEPYFGRLSTSASNYFAGDLGEVILFKQALTDANCRRMLAYLDEKWKEPVTYTLSPTMYYYAGDPGLGKNENWSLLLGNYSPLTKYSLIYK